MATHFFNAGKAWLLANDIAAADLRAALLMSSTTADTDNDAVDFVDDIGTLDECDGAGYAREALTTIAVSKDDANDRALLDADALAFGAIGAATRAVVGVLVYVHVGADSANIPICWLEYATPKTMDGSAFTAAFHADGVFEAV